MIITEQVIPVNDGGDFLYNLDVRSAVRDAGFRLYEIAAAVGLSEVHFSRKMNRAELTAEEKKFIFDALKTLCLERQKTLTKYVS